MRSLTAVLALIALAPEPAAAQMNILGPCRDGHRWMATTSGGAPVADYATCEGSQPLVIVACGSSGWPELRLAAAPGTALPTQGERLAATMAIDGRTPLELRLAPAASSSGGVAILRVQLTGEAVDAMARGSSAVLDAAGTRLELHLGASFDVLTLFNQRC
jgi:hypothetical protein